MKNLISIDFDFFIRENPIWDFGHSEDNKEFNTSVWKYRYFSVDLYNETDINVYADFNPINIISKLKWLGFKLNKPKIVISDSHQYIYKEIKILGDCNLINFDAHHDCWIERGEVNCANWLSKSFLSSKVKKITWVTPSWCKEFYKYLYFPNNFINLAEIKISKNCKKVGEKIKFLKNFPECYITQVYCDELKRNHFKNKEINVIFLCKSGSWVPPHHDLSFKKTVNKLQSITDNFKIIEKIDVRLFPSGKEALESFKLNKKQILSLDIPKTSVPILITEKLNVNENKSK